MPQSAVLNHACHVIKLDDLSLGGYVKLFVHGYPTKTTPRALCRITSPELSPNTTGVYLQDTLDTGPALIQGTREAIFQAF